MLTCRFLPMLQLLCLVVLLASAATMACALTRPADVKAVAEGRYERFRRVRVEVKTTPELDGKTVSIRDGAQTLATAELTVLEKDAVAKLTLPMPPRTRPYGPLAVRVKGKTLTMLALPDADMARMRALWDQRLSFQRYIFDGEKFPTCEFDSPSAVEDLIGEYRIAVRYLNAAGEEVTTAATPGRYGAIVDITGQEGQRHRRFVTLYRQPEKVNWWGTDLKAHCVLPAGLGIDPAVAQAQSAVLSGYLKDRFIDGLYREDASARFFAGLYEQTPQTLADPWEKSERWWFTQRKARGLIEHRYLANLPKGYDADPNARYPLVLFLHGSGERGIDLAQLHVHGPEKFLQAHPELPCILIMPQCDPDSWWSARYLNDLLDEVMAKYRVDPARVYLTGLSMGGYGSWTLACAYPERFAAVAPICGGGDPKQAARMKEIPTWVFHGDKDGVVPLAKSQEMVDALRAAGGAVRFTVYPGVGHNSWTATYNDPEFYTWLFAQRRPAR